MQLVVSAQCGELVLKHAVQMALSHLSHSMYESLLQSVVLDVLHEKKTTCELTRAPLGTRSRRPSSEASVQGTRSMNHVKMENGMPETCWQTWGDAFILSCSSCTSGRSPFVAALVLAACTGSTSLVDPLCDFQLYDQEGALRTANAKPLCQTRVVQEVAQASKVHLSLLNVENALDVAVSET